MVECLPEFEYFYRVVENIISKIRRSKVTDYAALTYVSVEANIVGTDQL